MRRMVFYLVLSMIVLPLVLASCRPQIDINAPKDPIKIEVKIELHIYQHAVQDLDYITGGAASPAPLTPPAVDPGKESAPSPEKIESKIENVLLALLGVGSAHGQGTSLQDQLKSVLDSMRKQYPTLSRYKTDKSIGENHLGYVEERPSPRMSNADYAKAVRAAITAENANRRLLYQIRARIDGVSPEKEAAIYAKAWRDKAGPGEWIEVLVDKNWVWKQK
jgi:uncharacterized protein YdbL (DUF1318 family)